MAISLAWEAKKSAWPQIEKTGKKPKFFPRQDLICLMSAEFNCLWLLYGFCPVCQGLIFAYGFLLKNNDIEKNVNCQLDYLADE